MLQLVGWCDEVTLPKQGALDSWQDPGSLWQFLQAGLGKVHVWNHAKCYQQLRS